MSEPLNKCGLCGEMGDTVECVGVQVCLQCLVLKADEAARKKVVREREERAPVVKWNEAAPAMDCTSVARILEWLNAAPAGAHVAEGAYDEGQERPRPRWMFGECGKWECVYGSERRLSNDMLALWPLDALAF